MAASGRHLRPYLMDICKLYFEDCVSNSCCSLVIFTTAAVHDDIEPAHMYKNMVKIRWCPEYHRRDTQACLDVVIHDASILFYL